jgi:hypothetical protein
MPWSQLFPGRKKMPPVEIIAELDAALQGKQLNDAALVLIRLAKKTGKDQQVIDVCTTALNDIAAGDLPLALKTANDMCIHAEGNARRSWGLRQAAFAGQLAETDFMRGIRELQAMAQFINPEEDTRQAAIEKLMEFSHRLAAAADKAPAPADAATISQRISAHSIAGNALLNMPMVAEKIRTAGEQARAALKQDALAQWSATADDLIAVAPASALRVLQHFASHAAGSYDPATQELPVMTGEKFLAAAEKLLHTDPRLAMEAARDAVRYGKPVKQEAPDIHGHGHGGHGRDHSEDEDEDEHNDHDYHHGHGHNHDDGDVHGGAEGDLEVRAVALWRHATEQRSAAALNDTIIDARNTARYSNGPLQKTAAACWSDLYGKLLVANPAAAQKEKNKAAWPVGGKPDALTHAVKRLTLAETPPPPTAAQLSACDFLKRHGKPQP